MWGNWDISWRVAVRNLLHQPTVKDNTILLVLRQVNCCCGFISSAIMILLFPVLHNVMMWILTISVMSYKSQLIKKIMHLHRMKATVSCQDLSTRSEVRIAMYCCFWCAGLKSLQPSAWWTSRAQGYHELSCWLVGFWLLNGRVRVPSAFSMYCTLSRY